MCDLHSLVCPTAAWGITALSTTTLLNLPHSDLHGIVVKYPAIALAFWRDGVADGSILAKWVGNLGRRDARGRLAHLICEVGLRMESAGMGTRRAFQLEATQTHLADALGLTPVHMNRVLQSLRCEGWVRTASRTVYVDDWPRLAAMADFDPDYLLLNSKGRRSGAQSGAQGQSSIRLNS